MPNTMNKTAVRNDVIRSILPLAHKDDRVMITRGIDALGPEAVADAIEVVRDYDEFTEGNDPYGEHDFGSFVLTTGDKCFWKIDDYNGYDGIRCVLTIMLAEEY